MYSSTYIQNTKYGANYFITMLNSVKLLSWESKLEVHLVRYITQIRKQMYSLVVLLQNVLENGHVGNPEGFEKHYIEIDCSWR